MTGSPGRSSPARGCGPERGLHPRTRGRLALRGVRRIGLPARPARRRSRSRRQPCGDRAGTPCGRHGQRGSCSYRVRSGPEARLGELILTVSPRGGHAARTPRPGSGDEALMETGRLVREPDAENLPNVRLTSVKADPGRDRCGRSYIRGRNPGSSSSSPARRRSSSRPASQATAAAWRPTAPRAGVAHIWQEPGPRVGRRPRMAPPRIAPPSAAARRRLPLPAAACRRRRPQALSTPRAP